MTWLSVDDLKHIMKPNSVKKLPENYVRSYVCMLALSYYVIIFEHLNTKLIL